MRYRIANPSLQKDASGTIIIPHTYGQWYISGNYVHGSTAVTNDNWLGVNPEGGDAERILCKSEIPFPVAVTYPVTTQTAQDAYRSVLDEVGCSLWRDSVDTRIIQEVKTGTATYGGLTGEGLGIIDSQTTVGGWPALQSLPALPDSDNDGMPDAWELSRGLNPYNPADRNDDRLGDGYTNLEEYLNWLVTPAARADLDRNCVIDLGDFAVLAASWGSQSGQANWYRYADIARPENGVIDLEDLMVLADSWLGESAQVPLITEISIPAVQGKAIQFKNNSGAWISEQRLKTRTAGTWNEDPSLNTLDANKSYLQFDLSGIKGTITAATLTIYAITPDKSYNVYGLNDGINETWGADTIDWFSAPGNQTTSGSALKPDQTVFLYSVSPTVADGPASGDVTSFVLADTDKRVTFILTPGGTTYLYNVIEGAYYNPDYVPVLKLEGTFIP